MMNFNDIQGRARDLLASRFEPEGVRLLGDIYWRTLLTFASACIAGAMLYGLWDLFGVLNILGAAPDTSPLPPAALNRPLLNQVVQGFGDRQNNFTTFKSKVPVTIPDPSK